MQRKYEDKSLTAISEKATNDGYDLWTETTTNRVGDGSISSEPNIIGKYPSWQTNTRKSPEVTELGAKEKIQNQTPAHNTLEETKVNFMKEQKIKAENRRKAIKHRLQYYTKERVSRDNFKLKFPKDLPDYFENCGHCDVPDDDRYSSSGSR